MLLKLERRLQSVAFNPLATLSMVWECLTGSWSLSWVDTESTDRKGWLSWEFSTLFMPLRGWSEVDERKKKIVIVVIIAYSQLQSTLKDLCRGLQPGLSDPLQHHTTFYKLHKNNKKRQEKRKAKQIKVQSPGPLFQSYHFFSHSDAPANNYASHRYWKDILELLYRNV